MNVGRNSFYVFIFAQVADQRAAGLNRVHQEVENAQIESSCHSMLLANESAAIPRRIADAEVRAAQEAEAEELLQVRFSFVHRVHVHLEEPSNCTTETLRVSSARSVLFVPARLLLLVTTGAPGSGGGGTLAAKSSFVHRVHAQRTTLQQLAATVFREIICEKVPT